MDSIESVILQNVAIQANGIIRNSKGRLIGRLVNDVDYNGEHIKLLNEPKKQDTTLSQILEDSEKELDQRFDFDGYGNSHIVQDIVKAFVRSEIRAAYKAGTEKCLELLPNKRNIYKRTEQEPTDDEKTFNEGFDLALQEAQDNINKTILDLDKK